MQSCNAHMMTQGGKILDQTTSSSAHRSYTEMSHLESVKEGGMCRDGIKMQETIIGMA